VGMMQNFQLKFEDFKQSCIRIFTKHPEIMIAYLYGSVVRNQTHKFSDLDIGIVAAHIEKINPLYSLEIQQELENILNIASKIPLDIHILNDASPRFLHQIIKEGKLLYFRDLDFKDEYELQVIHKYLDIKPLLEIFDNNYLEQNISGPNE
jgi:predicted nucleotidyltransferase